MKGNEDKKRFSVVMYWLAGRMKGQGGKPVDITPDFQRDYYEALDDIRIERIEWAAKHLFKTTTFFPMPNEIRPAAMLAPSTVLPSLALDRKEIPEFTEAQREDAAKALDDIINSFGKWGEV